MKSVLCVLLFLMLTVSSPVFAHTGLKSATPSEGEIVTEDIQEISLVFNTTIENKSSLSMLDGNGQEVELDLAQSNGTTLIGLTEKPLESGYYTVNWRIVGGDGHPMQGSYKFTVQLDNENMDKSNSAIEIKDENSQAANTTATAEEESPSSLVDGVEGKSESNANVVISLLTGFMLFVALQATLWLIRKGKR